MIGQGGSQEVPQVQRGKISKAEIRATRLEVDRGAQKILRERGILPDESKDKPTKLEDMKNAKFFVPSEEKFLAPKDFPKGYKIGDVPKMPENEVKALRKRWPSMYPAETQPKVADFTAKEIESSKKAKDLEKEKARKNGVRVFTKDIKDIPDGGPNRPFARLAGQLIQEEAIEYGGETIPKVYRGNPEAIEKWLSALNFKEEQKRIQGDGGSRQSSAGEFQGNDYGLPDVIISPSQEGNPEEVERVRKTNEYRAGIRRQRAMAAADRNIIR